MASTVEARHFIGDLQGSNALVASMVNDHGDPERFVDDSAAYISANQIPLETQAVVDTLIFMHPRVPVE